MSDNLIWLVAIMGLYWVYCIYWGVTGGRMSSSAADYLLADRRLPPWVYVITATGVSFSGWMLLGQPAFVFRDGFPFAETSLGAVAIALSGVVFLKRQWLLGKRFGYVTPGDMFADYFSSEVLPILVLLVALVFAIPFASMQLSALGYLVARFSGGVLGPVESMWVMTGIVFLYVSLGGARGTAYAGVLQGLLLIAGMVAIGIFAYIKLGGLESFDAALAKLGASSITPWGSSGKGYNSYFAVPGVIQFTSGIGRELPAGGLWTATMILSYSFALMGIQTAPPFTMWSFTTRSPRSFAVQQVWVSAGLVGIILLLFAVLTGMGAHFLGASSPETAAGFAVSPWLGELAGSRTSSLLSLYIEAISTNAPWFSALLVLCVVAGVQVMVAVFAVTTGSMLAHDVYRPYFNSKASHRQERLFARLGGALVIVLALLIASYFPATEAELGALALAFSFQLWPALVGICWFPWITREGATLGLLAGLAGVVLTEPFGASVAGFLGFHLPWGRWPFTVYSAAWGIMANVVVCVTVSLLTQRQEEREHRMKFHRFTTDATRLAPGKRALKPAAWALTVGWLFFALGPGAVVGNDLFGAPSAGVGSWVLGVPSLWAWQIIWWALGVMVIWFLAYKMEMSTVVGRSLEFGGPVRGYVRPAPVVADWRDWLLSLAVLAALLAVTHWTFS